MPRLAESRPSAFLIQPTSRTQPYRNDRERMPGAALTAMLAGRPTYTPNPMDYQRAFQAGSGPQDAAQGGLAALLLGLSARQPTIRGYR